MSPVSEAASLGDVQAATSSSSVVGSNISPVSSVARADKSYDSMMKSLMHASNEKSVMLNEIQSLKAQLKQVKRDAADLEKELSEAKAAAEKSVACMTTERQETSQVLPAVGTSYETSDGTKVVVVAAAEMLSAHKLLEVNIRTGIMCTLWAIKAQLTKRLCYGFSKWRIAARLCTAEIESEKKILAVWKESEEAIRNAKAVGSAVGGDAAAKVWMGTAMKLLALQKKKDERAASVERIPTVHKDVDTAASSPDASSRRSMRPRRSNVLLGQRPVTADIDLNPSEFTADSYAHFHDTDAVVPNKPQLYVNTNTWLPEEERGRQGFGLIPDDGEPLPEHSDDEAEDRRRTNSGKGRASQRGRRALRSQDRNFNANADGHAPFSTPGSGRSHGYPHYSGPGSASSASSTAAGTARRRKREVNYHEIQKLYRTVHDRQALARKQYSMQGLRERSTSPLNSNISSFLSASAAQAGKQYGRSESAPLQHFVALSNTGSKYSRNHNALMAHSRAKEQNFWGSDYTSHEADSNSNTFKQSPTNSAARRSPTDTTAWTAQSIGDNARSASLSPSRNKGPAPELSNYPSVAQWAAAVLQQTQLNDTRGRSGSSASSRRLVSGRNSVSSHGKAQSGRGKSLDMAFQRLTADTITSAAHRASREKRNSIRHQHEFEYSASHSHFLSDAHAHPDSYTNTSGDGGHSGRVRSHSQPSRHAQELQGGGRFLDAGKRLTAETMASAAHRASREKRNSIRHQHEFEYSASHSHFLSDAHAHPNINGRAKHRGEPGYSALRDGFSSHVVQDTYSGDSNGVPGLQSGSVQGTAEEIAEAERELEMMLGTLDKGSDFVTNGADVQTAQTAVHVEHQSQALEHSSAILASALERKRHAKMAVMQRFEAIAAAHHQSGDAIADSNRKGNTNVNSSHAIQSQTHLLHQEVEDAINNAASAKR